MAVGYALYGGSNIYERLSSADHIHESDDESWYIEFAKTAVA